QVPGAKKEVPGAKGQVSGEEALRSPGLLPKHYAPRARLRVLNWQDDADLRQQAGDLKLELRKCHVVAHTRIPSAEGFGGVSVIPHDAEAFARALYGELHSCDEAAAESILVEAPPETDEWRAITDR